MRRGICCVGLSALLIPVLACGARVEAPAAPAAATLPVPWTSNQAAPWTPPPVPTPSPYPTSAPACKAAQLHVGAMESGAAAGSTTVRFPLTNVGRPCSIGGRPRVFAIDPSGLRVEIQASTGHSLYGPLVPADLDTNAQAYLGFGMSGGCPGGSSTRYRGLSVELPQGGGTLDVGAELDSGTCGIAIDDLGVRPPAANLTPAPSPGSLAVLRARVTLPESAAVGAVMRYTVTLSNPGNADVSLSPCPSYTEVLGYPGNEQLTFRLNCAQVRSIAGASEVTYRMEFAIPASTPTGLTKFSWRLNVVGGAFAGAAIVLRPPSG